jgi:hypothetical protein
MRGKRSTLRRSFVVRLAAWLTNAAGVNPSER